MDNQVFKPISQRPQRATSTLGSRSSECTYSGHAIALESILFTPDYKLSKRAYFCLVCWPCCHVTRNEVEMRYHHNHTMCTGGTSLHCKLYSVKPSGLIRMSSWKVSIRHQTSDTSAFELRRWRNLCQMTRCHLKSTNNTSSQG